MTQIALRSQSISYVERRVDALSARIDKARSCTKGISCGSTCITKAKTCRVKGSPATAKIEQLVKAGPGSAAARPASSTSAAAADPKPPTAKQIAVQQIKVEDLQRRVKRPGGYKYNYQLEKAKAKLIDMKEHAADPASWAKKQQAKSELKAKQAAWQKLQEKLDARQQEASLSLVEEQALKDYTAATTAGERSHVSTNECARKTPCRDQEAQKHIKELDGALRKIPGNDDNDPFYRGVAVRNPMTERLFQFLAKARPGTVLKDPGFGSYSSNEDIADGFMTGERSIKFVNRNSELRPINRFSAITREYEALLPRNVPSTIRKVTRDGNTLIVELD